MKLTFSLIYETNIVPYVVFVRLVACVKHDSFLQRSSIVKEK